MDTPGTVDTLDTLTLARLDRESQGNWEAEYSYREEADLQRHYDRCRKNPGHENFIPIDKFSIKDLPARYRNTDMVDYIRAVSDLTVRVTVKYVSERRPKTVGVSGKPYLGCRYRGQWRTTVGTGWVESVFIWDDEMNATCKCKDCRKSSTPQTKFATISINTAAHVVFDKSEGEHTTCHLFFDEEGTPETCQGVVALNGMHCLRNDTDSDNCRMDHYTHDLELAQELDQRCRQRVQMRCNIITKLQETTKFKCSQPTLDKQPLLFIVSHPHGLSKQISIGRWTSAHEQSNGSKEFTYTAATCPGSSGAPVCIPHESDPVSRLTSLAYYSIHVGVCDKQPGMNCSTLIPGPLKYPDQYRLQLNKGSSGERVLMLGRKCLYPSIE
ncbi:hypothetical protein BsWGS_27306 [Bradybaena similaris]